MDKHKRKKTRKLRGHVSHGHGRSGKHRKHPSGRGKCGGFTFMKSYFRKYHPTFHGKRGMRVFNRKIGTSFYKSISLDRVYALFTKNEISRVETGVMPEINLISYGYHVLLGKGKLFFDKPISIRARKFTDEAIKRVESVGGRCIVSA